MSALRDRTFRRLLAAEAVSDFGDSALFLSLGIWGKDLTGSNSVAGSILAALAAPSLAAPLLGHLADRVHRQRLLIVTNVLTALALLPLLAVHSAGQVWILYLVALCYGVSFRVARPAQAGLLKDVLPSTDAAGARATITTVTSGLRALSPAAGAGIYALFGGAVLTLFDIGTFAVGVLLLLAVRATESEPDGDREPFRREVTGGFRHLRATPVLAQLVCSLAPAIAVTGLADSALYAAVARVGLAPAFVGVLLSVQGAGSILGGTLSGRLVRTAGEARAAGVGIALLAVGVATVLPASLAGLVAGMTLTGVGVPIMLVALGTATQLYTPARLQGRVNAVTNLFITGPQTVFIVIGAGLVAVLDVRVLFAVIAVVGAASSLPLLLHPTSPPPVVPSLADTPADLGLGAVSMAEETAL